MRYGGGSRVLDLRGPIPFPGPTLIGQMVSCFMVL
jgi:hypothetical protein